MLVCKDNMCKLNTYNSNGDDNDYDTAKISTHYQIGNENTFDDIDCGAGDITIVHNLPVFVSGCQYLSVFVRICQYLSV